MGSKTPAPQSGAGYQQTQAQMKVLKGAAQQLVDRAEQIQHRMRNNARNAAELADLVAAAQVAPVHVNTIGEVSSKFGRLAGGAAKVRSTAENLESSATRVQTRHRQVYGGIHEAVAQLRPGIPQPKPGFNRTT